MRHAHLHNPLPGFHAFSDTTGESFIVSEIKGVFPLGNEEMVALLVVSTVSLGASFRPLSVTATKAREDSMDFSLSRISVGPPSSKS